MDFFLQDEESSQVFKINDLNCTEDDFVEWVEDSDDVSKLEDKYGVLDFTGDLDGLGFQSYEIELKDYPVLLEEFRTIFKNLGWL
jgi:hypothetical protein